MKIIKILILVSVVSISSLAQNVKVASIEKLEIQNGYNPQFADGDTKIIFTKSNYKGLYSHDIISGKSETISIENGVGYKPLIAEDNTVYFRSTVLEKGRKFHSIKSKDLKTGEETILEKNKRLLKIPHQLVKDELTLIENKRIFKKKISENILTKTALPKKAIYVEKDILKLVDGDDILELSPLGKGAYVWASLSRNQEMIIFSFGNKGSFICDLTGNILAEIKDARYPKFSPDGKYVSYMIDEDNGINFISSDIYIYSLESDKSYTITDTEDKIEMYAEWSNDGKKIVAHTTDGEIFIANLEFEN